MSDLITAVILAAQLALLGLTFERLGKIMTDQTTLASDLAAIKDQLTKAAGEIVAKVAALEAAVSASGGTTPEVDAAVADLKAVAQALDDLNPDPAPV